MKRNATFRLHRMELVLAWGMKVAAGILYGYLFLRVYGGDDTWDLHQRSLLEYQKLLHQPGVFLADLLPSSAFRGAPDVPTALSYYIMDLENWLLPKLLGVFDIFSRGNYYINVVFFDALVFGGQLRFFSLLMKHYPGQRRLLFLAVFLFPPLLFWGSGIRAEGLLFLFMSIIWALTDRWLTGKEKLAGWKMAGAFAGVLIFRNVWVLLILPAWGAWILSVRLRRKALPLFLKLYALAGCLFFSTMFLPGRLNLLNLVANRQHSFLQLHGNTRFRLDKLEPTAISFLEVLPQAVFNCFFRPLPWEAKGWLQYAASAEILAFWSLVLIFFMRRSERWKELFQSPLLLSWLFFALTLYIFIGYSVPFPGAIIRYRAIGEFMLLTPFLIYTRWAKRISN